ncbi:ferritin family protein [Thermosediminibacter oceani]|uniref:Rubrerythrin n=1 Tax=Thermosediminibacter oceani (strain ATCC BAA-1034 / DSM 16646 / JW/IW-1228P) TaxID=555079 RepID=D9S082_THEOJ|nr:ferritin family protein [Thermosediminibacter oceani]ADL07010.1 Rubrerythrin [Thermosediminibacter oceani DSM 16646]
MSEEKVMHYEENCQMTLPEMLREGIIGELQAINQYERYARMTCYEPARQLFQEIADDEKHHVAELMKMLAQCDKRQAEELRRAFMHHPGKY